jgi:hypothetical protein
VQSSGFSEVRFCELLLVGERAWTLGFGGISVSQDVFLMTSVTGQFDDSLARRVASDERAADVTAGDALQPDIPALVSDLYDQAPEALRRFCGKWLH